MNDEFGWTWKEAVLHGINYPRMRSVRIFYGSKFEHGFSCHQSSSDPYAGTSGPILFPVFIFRSFVLSIRSYVLYISTEFRMPLEIRLINVCLNKTVLKSVKTDICLMHFLWVDQKEVCALLPL
jgi:hypothetical protein